MPDYVSDGAWGTGLGVPLNVAQFDGNTYEWATRITALEDNPPDANGIASIALNGLAWSITLDGGQVLGPYPIPVPLPHNRGEWMPAQLYDALDQFTVAGSGLYVVLLDHVTSGTFDADGVGPAETAGALIVGRSYVIATVGTTDFTEIGAESNTVGVEFKATGVGAGTGTAMPRVYHLLIGASTNTLIGDLADVDVSGAAANAMLVAVSIGSPATIEWQDRTPTQITALIDVFEGAVGSPADDGLKGLVPAPTAADAAANRVLRADGTWGVGSTVAALDDLSDVSTGGAVVGSVLRAAGSPLAWSPDLLSLDDLSDVALSAPAAGDFLRYDGGSPNGWTNEAGTATSGLLAATLPVVLASLLEISEASGSPAAYESRSLEISDLLDRFLASPALTGTPTAPTAAPGTNSTQVATTAYADAAATAIIAAADAMVFKGVIDCSADPNYPAADRGHTYRVSIAGKIGGASGPNVEVGDLLICLTDGTVAGTHAAVGANWSIIQTNLDGAVIGPASAVDSRIAAFDGTSGKLLKDGGIATSAILVSGGALGTPSSGVATNLTGAAAGLTSGSVTTNANLTGPITSVGNATAIASQTGTGTTLVVNTGPTISALTLTGATTLPGSGQVSSVGELGLGSSPSARLSVSGTYTSANANLISLGGTFASSVTSTQTAITLNPTFAPSGASLSSIISFSIATTLNSTAFTIADISINQASLTLGSSFSGIVALVNLFYANNPTVSGGSITTLNQFFGALITNGNALAAGSVTNRHMRLQGISSGSAGGTVNNQGIFLTMPSGGSSSGSTVNRGIYISGNGGTASGGSVTNHAIYSDSTAASLLSGELGLAAGKALAFKTGTGARAGDAVLVAGTVTVTNTTVTSATKVLLTRKTAGGTLGMALTYTLSAGASFTINSDNILDTSTITYMLVELN